jgi:hypothetical protein
LTDQHLLSLVPHECGALSNLPRYAPPPACRNSRRSFTVPSPLSLTAAVDRCFLNPSRLLKSALAAFVRGADSFPVHGPVHTSPRKEISPVPTLLVVPLHCFPFFFPLPLSLPLHVSLPRPLSLFIALPIPLSPSPPGSARRLRRLRPPPATSPHPHLTVLVGHPPPPPLPTSGPPAPHLAGSPAFCPPSPFNIVRYLRDSTS